jgi:hypothetical protein
MAGDWRIYLECLSTPGAKLAYVADPLNVHRRHAQSVTHSLKAQQHLDEISDVHRFMRERLVLPPAALASQTRYIEEVTKQMLGDAASADTSRKGKRREKRLKEAV